MKTFTFSAIVVLLAALDVTWSNNVATVAGGTYNTFCSLDTEARKALLECLAGKLPQAEQDITALGYHPSQLHEEICKEGASTFPTDLLALVGNALPHVAECRAQIPGL
uniref:Putative secreted protein n=1 Tax=Amblyomma triste TaxID=251400 RepID=A0A023G454_AMBTT